MNATGRLHDVTVELAGHRFRLRGADDDWHRRARARYEGFVADPDADAFLVDVAVSAGADPASVAAERETPPDARWETGHLRLRSATFTADADLAARRATVTGPPLAYPVDALLRFLLAAVLDDGLLIHAALLVEGDRSWLATGRSGCGKSTLASLLPEQAAADELAAVRVRPDGVTVGFGLPYWRGRACSAPLAGIHVLSHAPVSHRSRLDGLEAMRRLAPEVMWPLGPPGAVESRLALLTSVVARVPVWALGFRPDREVWDTISQGDGE